MNKVERTDKVENIVRRYTQDKEKMRFIAVLEGVSVGFVHKILHENGVLIRTTGEQVLGRKHTPEVCAIISKAHKGKFVSQETCLKISKSKRGSFKRISQFGGHKKPRFDGYIMVYAPDNAMATVDGYVLEHRLIMSEILGRPLKDEEVVHHANGIRNDNRPENLMLFNGLRDHQKYHGYFRRMKKCSIK